MRIGFGSQSVRNFSGYRRAAGLKLLLCALALGFVAVAHAQPFPSFLLDTTRFVGRDLRFSFGCIATAASRSGGVVAWTTLGEHVCASRVTRSMDLIDTIPQDVTGPVLRASTSPAAACSDSGYAYAWHYGGGSMEYLWLALASRFGDIKARVVIDSQVQVNCISMAASSDRFAVVSTDWYPEAENYEVRASEVSPSGVVLRRGLVASGVWPEFYLDAADVARGDSAYLVVWQGTDSTSNNCIYGRFIWADGLYTDTLTFPIRQGVSAFGPKVAFDSKNFWVAWLEQAVPVGETLVKAARVSQSGVLLDTGGIVLASHATGLDVAADRETTLVSWDADTTSTLVCMRFDAEAHKLDSVSVVLSTKAVGPPATTVTRDTFLALWNERAHSTVPESEYRLAGRRATASGVLVDAQARDYAYTANSHGGAALASDGENFLAVWADVRAAPDYSARFRGRRFDNQGRFLDEEPFTIGGIHEAPLRCVMTYGAGCYLLCWCEDGDLKPVTIYATRISQDGSVMDTAPIPLCYSTYWTGDLDATYLRDSMFVVSVDTNTHNHIEVVRVMADGRVLDSVPVGIGARGGGDMYNNGPSLASMGDTLVLACKVWSAPYVWVGVGMFDPKLNQLDSVWWRTHTWDFETDVACGAGRILADQIAYGDDFLWVLDSAGNLLDTVPMQGLVGNHTSIAYDGENFLCANALTGGHRQKLWGYRVSPNGDLLDPEHVELVAFESTHVTDDCALAADTLGHVGLVFFSFETEGHMSSRARATVFPRLTGGVEEARGAPMPRYLCQTIVGRALKLPRGTKVRAYLLMDISGRKVMDLSPGANDVRALAPGVYFVREAQAQAQAQAVRKIVLTE